MSFWNEVPAEAWTAIGTASGAAIAAAWTRRGKLRAVEETVAEVRTATVPGADGETSIPSQVADVRADVQELRGEVNRRIDRLQTDVDDLGANVRLLAADMRAHIENETSAVDKIREDVQALQGAVTRLVAALEPDSLGPRRHYG